MASVYMSPLSVIVQYFTNIGVIAAGGQITTYLAGSVSTLQTTYTDSTGLVQNPNPMTLNSAGRPAGAAGNQVAFWVSSGAALRAVFSTPQGGAWTLDNIPNINDPAATGSLQAQLASAANSNVSGFGPVAGADLVANAIKSYDVIADLRAANVPQPASGQTLSIQVQGSAAINDGLGGDFYWNSTSVATDNGTTVVNPTANTGAGRWLRLRTPPLGTMNGITAAATTDLGTLGSNIVQINGNTTITSFGGSASTANPVYLVYFQGTPLLTFSGSLQTPGGGNIQASAGDFAILLFLGGTTWVVLTYQRFLTTPPGDSLLVLNADDPTTNNVVNLNIPGLSQNLVPGTYRVKLLLMFAGTGGTGQGYQFQLNYSGTFVGQAGGAGVASSNLTASAVVVQAGTNKSIAAVSSTVGSPDVVNVDYVFQVATAGALNAQFAQAVSSANATTVKAGSQMTITRVL